MSRLEDGAGWAWLGVAVLCGCAALAALLTLFLVPIYAGSVVIPVAVVLALASNIALPRLARSLVSSTAGATLPFATWMLVVLVVGVMARPEGDVVLPGGGAVQWVAYGVLLGGFAAGMVTISITGTKRRPSREQLSR